MYYLQSRYYDPTVGRFINADDPEQSMLSVSVFAVNLLAYCRNNGITNTDTSGFAFFTALLIGFVAGAVISGVSKVISNKKKGKKWYDGLALSMLAGGIGGSISCVSVPGWSSWVCAAIFGAVGNLTTKVIVGEIKSVKDVLNALAAGAAAGLIGNAASKFLIKCVRIRFPKWSTAKQRKFLGSIGKITNKTLKDIRRIIHKTGSTKVMEQGVSQVLDKYGYTTAVSAFVSSTLTSA